MAYVRLHGGGGLWVMGPAVEVRAAIHDDFFYERGAVVLRWQHCEGTLLLDPELVRDVVDEVPAGSGACPDCGDLGVAGFEPCLTCEAE